MFRIVWRVGCSFDGYVGFSDVFGVPLWTKRCGFQCVEEWSAPSQQEPSFAVVVAFFGHRIQTRYCAQFGKVFALSGQSVQELLREPSSSSHRAYFAFVQHSMLFVTSFPLRIFFAVAELNLRVFVYEFDNNMVADCHRGSVCCMDMTVNVWFRRRLRSDIDTGVSFNLAYAVATSFFDD